MQNIFDQLIKLLKKDERFVSSDDNLLKNQVQELARKNDPALIKLLLSDKSIKQHFFFKVDDVLIFDKEKFVRFISNKQFLPDSYTTFKNKIGLTVDNEYLSENKDVVLVWPYKDCVLEGGMTKEDQSRDEIFYNETLAPDDINRLLDAKVFTNFKQIDKNGEHKLDSFKRDEKGTIKDNLIIKGNNLLALASLKKEFAGKVKLIYIDPPYNTGNDGFNYNDTFNHSSWLVFMKNRLEIAKTLLSDDGVIFVQCDDNEFGYLKVLMDGIFGRENYLNAISIKTKTSSGASGGGEDKKLKKNIEYALCYCKPYFEKFNPLFEETELMKYIEQMKEDGTSFKYINVLLNMGEKEVFKTIKDGSGNDIKIFKIKNYEIKTVKQLAKEEKISEKEVYLKYFDRVMTTTNAQTSIRERVWQATDNDNNLYSITYIPKSGKNKGKDKELFFTGKQKVLVIWLKDTATKKDNNIYKKEKVGTLWEGFSWINVSKEGQVMLPNGKKPEELLRQFIDISTDQGDIILDFFAGSGTSGAVAHKLMRQYILVEQLDDHIKQSIERIKNVIKGDQSGISKSVDWKGGGDFVYMQLAKWNEEWIEKIEKAKSNKELLKIWDEMKEAAFLSYKVDPKIIDTNAKEFADLSIDNQKKFLIECLDKNQLYVNYSEIEDKEYGVSSDDKKLNKEFYG